MDTKTKGFDCESVVTRYLQDEGHTILERNYRCPMGEIDILSLSPEGILCVTEVKSLTRHWDGNDVRYMVDNRKFLKLKRTLEHYLASGHEVGYSGFRFDVATVTAGHVTYYRGEN